jgi:hypothetical protein
MEKERLRKTHIKIRGCIISMTMTLMVTGYPSITVAPRAKDYEGLGAALRAAWIRNPAPKRCQERMEKTTAKACWRDFVVVKDRMKVATRIAKNTQGPVGGTNHSQFQRLIHLSLLRPRLQCGPNSPQGRKLNHGCDCSTVVREKA